MRVGVRLGLLLPAKLLSTSAKLIAGTPSARWSVAFDCPNWPYSVGNEHAHKHEMTGERRAALAERGRATLRWRRDASGAAELQHAKFCGRLPAAGEHQNRVARLSSIWIGRAAHWPGAHWRRTIQSRDPCA